MPPDLDKKKQVALDIKAGKTCRVKFEDIGTVDGIIICINEAFGGSDSDYVSVYFFHDETCESVQKEQITWVGNKIQASQVM